MDPSYDVRIWNVDVYEGKRRTTYRLRWGVAGRPFSERFATPALADAFRSKLLMAMRVKGQFDLPDGGQRSSPLVDGRSPQTVSSSPR